MGFGSGFGSAENQSFFYSPGFTPKRISKEIAGRRPAENDLVVLEETDRQVTGGNDPNQTTDGPGAF
jgi:hypothetical protein